jgi:hypothetical protein
MEGRGRAQRRGSWSWLPRSWGGGIGTGIARAETRETREGVELIIGRAGVRANGRSARQRKAKESKLQAKQTTLPYLGKPM